MNRKDLILVIDGEGSLFEQTVGSAYFSNYELKRISDPAEAAGSVRSERPDLIISEIVFKNGTDGFELIRTIKETDQTVPLMIVSEMKDTADVVLALEMGADEYVAMPLSLRELSARVKALIRFSKNASARASVVRNDPGILRFPGLTLDKNSYRVTLRGEELAMPPKEIELLFYLASEPNKMFTREQLLQGIWGIKYFGGARTIDVHIKRIRSKLQGCGCSVQTIWGKGYKFVVDQAGQ